jgi:hypothetical protein
VSITGRIGSTSLLVAFVRRVVAGRLQAMKEMIGDDVTTLREIEQRTRPRPAHHRNNASRNLES